MVSQRLVIAWNCFLIHPSGDGNAVLKHVMERKLYGIHRFNPGTEDPVPNSLHIINLQVLSTHGAG